MKNKIKEERAITLIALVVTIIVLLILAGVSISMLTGQNGILNRANEAKSSTEVAQTEETLQVSVMEAMSQGLGKIMADNLKTALNNNVGAGKYEFSEENEICTVKIGEKSVANKNIMFYTMFTHCVMRA